MEELKPIRCRHCGKLFLCKGRYNLFHRLLPVPYANCLDKIDCECENCHSPNKGNSICGNIDISYNYNPSSRESK